MNDIVLNDGTILARVHGPEECQPENCCIHNPSDHPLRDAPLAWLELLGGGVMGRRCEHGLWHPDPDALAFLMATFQWMKAEAVTSVHLVRENCDGCCHGGSDV